MFRISNILRLAWRWYARVVKGVTDSPRKIGRPGNLFLALMVVAAIAAVAYADFIVQTISLGYLYLLPLAMCGFVFRLRISLLLVLLCFLLQDWLGPFAHYGWEHFARNLVTLAAFVTVVLVVDHLTGQRRQLSKLVRQQRDELAREIETGGTGSKASFAFSRTRDQRIRHRRENGGCAHRGRRLLRLFGASGRASGFGDRRCVGQRSIGSASHVLGEDGFERRCTRRAKYRSRTAKSKP